MSMGCHSVEETFFAQPMDFAAFKTPLPVSTSEATAATIVTPPAISNSSPTHLVSSRRRSSWTSVSTKKPYLNGVKANSQHHKLFLRTADTLLTPPTTPPALLPSKRLVKVECQVRARIPTPAGEMFLHLYKNTGDNKEHLAVVYGNDIRSKSLDTPRPGETEMDRIVRGAYTGRLRPDESGTSLIVSPSPTNHQQPLSSPLVRIHSECFTGETVQSARCDCGEQLQEAMRLIQEEGRGVVVYLRQEGRGIGLADKLRAYNLQDLGHDTVTANLMLHHPPDLRNYDIATQILADLGLTKVRLLTNNPDKIEQLEGEGVKVVERIPMVPHAWKHDYDPNRLGSEMDQYLKVKVERMRHLLNIPEALLS